MSKKIFKIIINSKYKKLKNIIKINKRIKKIIIKINLKLKIKKLNN